MPLDVCVHFCHDKCGPENTEGDFHNGLPSGRGTYHYSNGDVYAGELLDDNFHGSGVYTKADKSGYKGEFEHGARHGHGESFQASGHVLHVGTYANNQFCGKGVYRYPAGDTYEGDFAEGKFHGQGVYTMQLEDGSTRVLEGEFRDGKYCEE